MKAANILSSKLEASLQTRRKRSGAIHFTLFSGKIVTGLLLCYFGLVLGGSRIANAQTAPVNSKITWGTLMLLEQQLHSAKGNEAAQAKIGKQILKVGEPLLDGDMGRSNARAVAAAITSGTGLGPEQRSYFGFWLLRATAAVDANDAASGNDAAAVLQRLGCGDSQKEAVVAVMVGLNDKGWLSDSFDPNKFDFDAFYWRAKEFFLTHPSISIESAADAINIDPNDPDVYLVRAWAYREMGDSGATQDYDLAIKDFTTAVTLASDDWIKNHIQDLYGGRADCYKLRGDWDRAIDDYNAEVKGGQYVGVSTYASLAALYAAKGEYGRAIEVYRLALKREPYEENSFAWLLSTCPDGRFRNGNEALKLVRRPEPGDFSENYPPQWDLLAAVNAEVGQFEDAVKMETLAIEKVNAKISANDSTVQAYFGVKLESHGDTDKSLQGALVSRLDAGDADNPAMRAGIIPGDLITGINGTKVDTSDTFNKVVSGMRPNTEIDVRILRQGQERIVKVKWGDPLQAYKARLHLYNNHQPYRESGEALFHSLEEY